MIFFGGEKMGTSIQDIREWFKRGIENKATHLIVACDTFDYEDYPVFVSSKEDVKEREKKIETASMQRVMEVYNLSQDMEKQLKQERSFNY